MLMVTQPAKKCTIEIKHSTTPAELENVVLTIEITIETTYSKNTCFLKEKKKDYYLLYSEEYYVHKKMPEY